MTIDARAAEDVDLAHLPARHLVSARLELAKPVVMAGTRVGARLYQGVLGGTLTGPRLTGTVVEHGGWIDTTAHEDGWAEITLRLLLHTDDHAVVEMVGSGTIEMTPEQRALLTVRFRVAHPNHSCLERAQAVAFAIPGRDEISLDVYALR